MDSSPAGDEFVELMKVGRLAARTGLSVRTLHHYDEIGLLHPARRTPSGHRLYGEAQVRRLQQIASLRQLGLSLDEIRGFLEGDGLSLGETLGMQIERLQEDIRAKERLVTLLVGLKERVDGEAEVSVEEVTRAIAGTVAVERYFSPEQLERLSLRRDEVGERRMQSAQREWAQLFEAYGEAMDAGLDPGSAEVQALARRSRALIEEFTGGDPEIRASLGRMYAQEGAEAVMARQGMAVKPGLWEYMGRAAKALPVSEAGER